VLDETRRNAGAFVWNVIPSVDALGRIRMQAMHRFLGDVSAGGHAGRYVAAALPHLPFAPGTFDLALCSHFLFLYSTHLDEAFHHAALLEMCRVAREVRVFPLLALDGTRSPHVDALIAALQERGLEAAVERTGYEFQRGGNELLTVTCRC
jgi:hypothetical protein